MAPELRTWEEVLTAVEADAERTVALLDNSADAPIPADVPLVLPPLAAMPPVPEHLRDRVGQLRQRIDDLEAELRATLREWAVPAMPANVTLPAAPRFLDRRV